jgi:hypothetical protein
MFETVPRKVTLYSVLDVIEGTVELNAGAPRLTDWLASDRDWLLLRDARVTPRAGRRTVEVPEVRVNLARVECLVDAGEPVTDERFLVARVKVRIDARVPSGLIVSGLISLPEGATWVTAVDVIDDDDRLKPLEDATIVWDGEALQRGVTALVRLKAALYLREDEAGELVSVLLGEGTSDAVRVLPKPV